MSDEESYEDDYQDDFDLDESLGESNTSGLSTSNNNNSSSGLVSGNKADKVVASVPSSASSSSRRKDVFRKDNNLGVNPSSDVNADVLAPLTSTRSGGGGDSRSVSFATSPRGDDSRNTVTRSGAAAVNASRQQPSDIINSASVSRSNTNTNSTYSDTFESLRNSGAASAALANALPPQPPSVPLPRRILELRKQVEKYSKSGDKMQLMENLELLEIALVQHKIESSKSTEYRRAQAKEKQKRAEARRARHYKAIQQLKKENAENLHFRNENTDLVNQLRMSNSLYESEKNSSKQVRIARPRRVGRSHEVRITMILR